MLLVTSGYRCHSLSPNRSSVIATSSNEFGLIWSANSFVKYLLVERIYQKCHQFRNYVTKTSKLYQFFFVHINITVVELDRCRWRNTIVGFGVVVMIGLVNTDRISHQAISNLDNQTWIILALFMIMIPHVHDQREFQPRNLEGVLIPLIQKRLNF